MSDGGKSGLSQLATDISEAVVKPVTSEVGQAIEQGVGSVVGSSKPPDPGEEQKKQQKRLEEEKKKAWALRVIEWNKQLQAAQDKVRKEEEEKRRQGLGEDEEKKKVKQFEIIKKQQKQGFSAVRVAQTKTEIKRGVGG